MPKQFTGIPQYVTAAAIARGHRPGDAKCPRTLDVGIAKTQKLITQAGDALSQASAAKPEHKAGIASRAVDILWMLGVMKEGLEAALLELYADHELPVETLMKVIEHGSGHGNGDGDRRVGDDLGSAQDGRPPARPRQDGGDQRRKS